MDKAVFQVYLANDSANEGRSTSVVLPASPYMLLDALEQVPLKEGDNLLVEIEEYFDFGFLAPHFEEGTSLEDLNALASRLACMESYDRLAFEGLITMEVEKRKPFGVSRMIDLAYSTDCCHVVSDVHTDKELGRFYAGNGFIPKLESLPDDIFELLDFERIGREAREGECGVFTSTGYVLQDEDLNEIYGSLDKTLRKPDYTFRLALISAMDGQAVTLDLPATQKQLDLTLMEIDLDSWENVRIHSYDGPLWGLNINATYQGGIDRLNRLAKVVKEFDESGMLQRYKAILEAEQCANVRTALKLAEQVEDYSFTHDILTPEDMGREEIRTVTSGKDATLLLRHVNLYSYGKELLDMAEGKLTSYGLIIQEDSPEMGFDEAVGPQMQM